MPVTGAGTGWTQEKFNRLAGFARLRGSKRGFHIFRDGRLMFLRPRGDNAIGRRNESGRLRLETIALLVFGVALFGTVIR